MPDLAAFPRPDASSSFSSASPHLSCFLPLSAVRSPFASTFFATWCGVFFHVPRSLFPDTVCRRRIRLDLLCRRILLTTDAAPPPGPWSSLPYPRHKIKRRKQKGKLRACTIRLGCYYDRPLLRWSAGVGHSIHLLDRSSLLRRPCTSNEYPRLPSSISLSGC